MKSFFLNIPKISENWSKEELNEIAFVKQLYKSCKDKIEIRELYENFVFSFILKRTFNAFLNKFHRYNEEINSELKLPTIVSRIDYLKKSLKTGLSMKFKKDYFFLIYQDALKLGILK